MGKAPPLYEPDPNRWGTPGRRLLAHIEVRVWRIWARCKRAFKPEAPVALAAPPDPAAKFPHPDNKELFTYLARSARPATANTGPAWQPDGYRVRTHPDLIEFLYSLMDTDQVIKGYAYGAPVLATLQGLIFAWAGGTHYIFIKLRPEHHEAARSDNGRFDATYGRDWIEFRYGGLRGAPPDWCASIQRWIMTSFRDSTSSG